MKKIGIIGAGNMGSGIVQKTAQEGLSVVMMDIKPEFVDKGLSNIQTTLKEGVERKLFKPEQVDDIMSRIQGTTDLGDTKDCDLVIEAVFEDMEVQKAPFSSAIPPWHPHQCQPSLTHLPQGGPRQHKRSRPEACQTPWPGLPPLLLHREATARRIQTGP